MATGERFEIDLDSSEDEKTAAEPGAAGAPPKSLNFIKDIVERDPTKNAAPAPAPQPTSSRTGFPDHKKRTRPSRFRQKHGGITNDNAGAGPQAKGMMHRSGQAAPTSLEEQDRMQARADSQRTLDSMSREEIEEERRELLAGEVPGLTPSLIERLLKRANVNEPHGDPLIPPPQPVEGKDRDFIKETRQEGNGENTKDESTTRTRRKNVAFTEPSQPGTSIAPPQTSQPPFLASTSTLPSGDTNTMPIVPPIDLRPAISKDPLPARPPPPQGVHFPMTEPPDLDPSSPNFLSDLRDHYFPHLAPNPSTLSWMAPTPANTTAATKENSTSATQPPTAPSTYDHPTTSISLAASELRFDFKGHLLPPTVSLALPSTLGLHHHGLAPDAAGYTIPELARLARSAMPAQRCVAYQTLGRILYRLGKGEFGGAGDDLYEGLWACVEKGRVTEVLVAEASGSAWAEGGSGEGNMDEGGKKRSERNNGSRSAWACATEAVWNWKMGGGRTRIAG